MKSRIKAIVWVAVALGFLAVAVVVGVNLISTGQAINRQDAIREIALRQPEPNPVAGAVPSMPISENPEIPDTSETPETPEAYDTHDAPYQSEPTTELPEARIRRKQSKPNERFINFEELWELNPDVVAWIEIPGTVIDYPVVSTLCNEFYIYHDLLGHRTGYGALFTDIRNNENWQDPFIVIYGHNMRDGRKFSDLHYFIRQRFFSENRTINIFTPEGQYVYRIFAVFERDNEHLMHARDFRNRETMREYLDSIRDNDWPYANIDMDGITEYDSILALSTCVGWGDRRLVVHAVFVEPEVGDASHRNS